jgi:hypothetical protein
VSGVYRASLKPLVLVSGLTLADYLLWNWSLNHNRDVLALVSGLTLPLLVLASLWLLGLSLARLLARSTHRSSGRGERRRARAALARRHHHRRGSRPATGPTDRSPAPATSSTPPSRKIAA